MTPETEAGMRVAIEEAKQSLREGYRGVGAVVLKGGRVLVQEHDTEGREPDPAAHAEMRAIRRASRLAGRDLSGCLLLSTLAPCVRCLEVMREAGLYRVVFGHGAGVKRQSEPGPLSWECSLLYNGTVRKEVERLRGASDEQLLAFDLQLTRQRLEWFQRERANLRLGAGDVLEQAYRMLLNKLGIDESEAPVASREIGRIVFHSTNFCPTLEACKILELDTRRVCRLGNEGATDALVRQLDPRLRFRRSYEKIRPHCPYCEERIELAGDGPEQLLPVRSKREAEGVIIGVVEHH